MSRQGRITRPFGDGHHEFFLGIAQLDELDEKTGVGPGTLIKRISAGDFRARDMHEVHRLGLIGGGMRSGEAIKLVERYVDPPNPLFDAVALAIDILAAALYAPEPKQRKKKAPSDDPATTATGSTSTPSMATVQ